MGSLEGVITALTVDTAVGAMDGRAEETEVGEIVGAVEEALDGIALAGTTAEQMASVVAAKTTERILNG